MVESVIHPFETGLIANGVWRSRSPLELAIVSSVARWKTARLNIARPHESLGDVPPAAFETGHAARCLPSLFVQ